MSQSKKMSFTESLVNVAIGYGVAILSQILVFPLFGIHIPIHDNLLIGLWFTLISIIRSYVLRRVFNNFKGKITTRTTERNLYGSVR